MRQFVVSCRKFTKKIQITITQNIYKGTRNSTPTEGFHTPARLTLSVMVGVVTILLYCITGGRHGRLTGCLLTQSGRKESK